ncbi:MAG: alpha-L-rhamnosidase C-terminal domain-containing protein, partial [Proteiniphilum sp.]|nr:alpha-L-rhamnosidase C-terminal domain-containing protein [Proteiniphilum sp.]
PLYANWLQAWGDVIREDGGLPHTAPSPYRAGGGPFWCGFVILASWKTYQHYGDIRILEKYYPVMQKWLEYVERYRVDGLLKQWPNTDYRNWYLGDWATPESVGNPDHLDERSVDLVNNCFVSSCFGMMSEIASVLGIEEDKERYSEMKIDLNRKIHDTFYCNELGYYSTGSQIDLIFPLLAGVTPKELRKKLVTTLIQKTKNEYDGHLNTGLVGIPVMMEWAATANEPDFIYSMLKQKSYPGYLYMIEKGATTTWEHWNGHRSRMHNCYNGVGQWFYQVIGGIRPIKGEIAYKKFIIQPQIPKGVVWAKTSKETPYGKIVVDWELENEKIKIFVEVPVGSTGFLEYPAGTTEIIMNNEEVSTDAEKIELESGKHMIEYIMD